MKTHLGSARRRSSFASPSALSDDDLNRLAVGPEPDRRRQGRSIRAIDDQDSGCRCVPVNVGCHVGRLGETDDLLVHVGAHWHACRFGGALQFGLHGVESSRGLDEFLGLHAPRRPDLVGIQVDDRVDC